MEQKIKQLGMNPSTASHRLIKDLLFDFIIKSGHKCHRCNGELTRETFSVEHITPWLDSENPLEMFFDLNNIAYSHLLCNTGARRQKRKVLVHGTKTGYNYGCRCRECRVAMSQKKAEWRKRSGKH